MVMMAVVAGVVVLAQGARQLERVSDGVQRQLSGALTSYEPLYNLQRSVQVASSGREVELALVVDQRGNTFIEDLNRNILISMPRHAVLFEQGDIFYNGLGYLTLVQGERPDVTPDRLAVRLGPLRGNRETPAHGGVDLLAEDLVERLAHDRRDVLLVPALGEREHRLADLLHLLLVGSDEHEDHLRVDALDDRAARQQALAVERLAEREHGRLRDDRLVEVEEGG